MNSIFVAVVFTIAFIMFAVSFVAMNLHDLARRQVRREEDE